MASLNKVMLIGNVTRDPEVKFTPKGRAVADLGLAINRSYANQAGEKVEEVTYVDVELWGRLAEIIPSKSSMLGWPLKEQAARMETKPPTTYRYMQTLFLAGQAEVVAEKRRFLACVSPVCCQTLKEKTKVRNQ